MNIKTAIILDVTPCNLFDVCQSFPIIYCFHLYPENGGNKFFRKIGKGLPDYTVSRISARLF